MQAAVVLTRAIASWSLVQPGACPPPWRWKLRRFLRLASEFGERGRGPDWRWLSQVGAQGEGVRLRGELIELFTELGLRS